MMKSTLYGFAAQREFKLQANRKMQMSFFIKLFWRLGAAQE